MNKLRLKYLQPFFKVSKKFACLRGLILADGLTSTFFRIIKRITDSAKYPRKCELIS